MTPTPHPPADRPCPERGDAARRKLIEAGLKVFSAMGYQAASTRKLAAEAGVNIAAIPYYFGSKEGLYLAVIGHILDYYRTGLGGSLSRIRQALADETTGWAEYRALLDEHMRTLIRFILQETQVRAQVSHIYIREQLDPTSAFDRLYEGFIRDAQDTMAALVGKILGDAVPAIESRLLGQTMLGQISTFKLSRETILHDFGWDRYSGDGLAEIERIIMKNVDSIIKSYVPDKSQNDFSK
jgi:AcrR family transcriptional regulator